MKGGGSVDVLDTTKPLLISHHGELAEQAENVDHERERRLGGLAQAVRPQQNQE